MQCSRRQARVSGNQRGHIGGGENYNVIALDSDDEGTYMEVSQKACLGKRDEEEWRSAEARRSRGLARDEEEDLWSGLVAETDEEDRAGRRPMQRWGCKEEEVICISSDDDD